MFNHIYDYAYSIGTTSTNNYYIVTKHCLNYMLIT